MTGSRIEIQSVKKRGFLNQIAQAAIQSGIPLGNAINNAQASVFSPTFQKGRIVVHQSGSGQSGSFQVMSGAEWTQDNIFGLLQEFSELLLALQNNFWSGGVYTFPDGTTLPADNGQQANTQQIYAAMRTDDSLVGVTEQLGDWTGLNVPSIGGIPSA